MPYNFIIISFGFKLQVFNDIRKLLHVHVCSDNEGNLIARLYYQLRSLRASSPFMVTKVRRERTCKRVAKLLGAKFFSCMTSHDVLRWESFV